MASYCSHSVMSLTSRISSISKYRTGKRSRRLVGRSCSITEWTCPETNCSRPLLPWSRNRVSNSTEERQPFFAGPPYIAWSTE